MIQLKTRSTSRRVLDLLYPELLHQEGPATRSQVREERLQRIPHGKTTPKEVSKETKWKHTRSIYPWYVVQKDDDRVGSLWRSHSWNEQTCKRRPQSYCHRRRNWCLSWQLVDPFEFGEFRHDADKASTWLQESAVDIVPPQENGGQRALWKLVAQFLLMVAMAHYLVASQLWDFTTKMDWTLIERRNLCNQWTAYLFVAWISQRIWCTIYRDYIGNSQRSLLSPTGGVKSTSPDTENHVKNGYVKLYDNKNFIMTNVDNNTDSKNTNTNDMNKHDTRDLHKWALQRTVSRRSSCW